MRHKGGILLNISSPESHVVGHMVSQVKLPGTAGSFTVLGGHAPLITSLSEGDIEYIVGGEVKSVHIKSGFAEVQNDTVSVCAEIQEKQNA